MIQVQMRKKAGSDHEAVAAEGLPVMVEVTGFSEESEGHALYRLARGLEYFLGADAVDLEVESPGGKIHVTTTSRIIDAWIQDE